MVQLASHKTFFSSSRRIASSLGCGDWAALAMAKAVGWVEAPVYDSRFTRPCEVVPQSLGPSGALTHATQPSATAPSIPGGKRREAPPCAWAASPGAGSATVWGAGPHR